MMKLPYFARLTLGMPPVQEGDLVQMYDTANCLVGVGHIHKIHDESSVLDIFVTRKSFGNYSASTMPPTVTDPDTFVDGANVTWPRRLCKLQQRSPSADIPPNPDIQHTSATVNPPPSPHGQPSSKRRRTRRKGEYEVCWHTSLRWWCTIVKTVCYRACQLGGFN